MIGAGPRRRSRRLHLRPVFPEDVPYLYHLVSDPPVASTWRFQGIVPEPATFAETYRTGVSAQFLVCRNGDAKPIGHVVSYSENMRSGVTYFGGAFERKAWRTGLSVEGMLLFLTYLFEAFPLRKIYAEMEVNNYRKVSSGEGLLFEVEGRLSEHLYWNGSFRDVLILAFRRESFLACVHSKYHSLLCLPGDEES